jgi:hypothetical protein
VLVLCTACGGDVGEPASEEPALPAALAEELAVQADQLAETIDAGDLCRADEQADTLASTATDAISNEQVPAVMADELKSTVDLLASGIKCEEEDEPGGRGKGKGNGEGRGDGKGSGKGNG